MAQKTILSDNEVFDFLEHFPIPPVQSATFIAEGSENSNYIIKTSSERYVLTILENSVDQSILPYIHDVFVALEAHNALTPKLITALDGKKIHTIQQGKRAVLQTFLDGYTERDPSEEQCFVAGRALANFHSTLNDSNLGFMPNPYNHNGLSILLTERYDAIAAHHAEFQETLEIIKSELEQLEKCNFDHLPEGVVHGVFFRENVLFTESLVTGVIDLWFTCSDYLAYDLALALADFGFRKGRFIEDRFWAFIEGYHSIRPLTDAEQKALPELLKLASIRFALTYMNSHINENAPRRRNHEDLEKVFSILDFCRKEHIDIISELSTSED